MTYKYLGKKKTIWLLLSAFMLLPGILALIFWQLPLGIDFKGGGSAEWKFDTAVDEEKLRNTLTEQGILEGFSVSNSGENSVFVKFLPITEGEYRKSFNDVNSRLGPIEELTFENVGPSVSKDLTRKAITAVIVASLFILIYLAYAFRGVSAPVSSWRFGVVALAALIHDLAISIGIFAILAHFFNFEVNSSMITAVLTIMGFSVHDTIVVFDRIRENLHHNKTETIEEFERVADASLAQTINRSLGTSLTLMFTLFALLLIGGESIRGFVVMMTIGVAVGTYSSIFTATPLLTIWQAKIYKSLKNKLDD